MQLPEGFASSTFTRDDIDIHYVSGGAIDAPLMVFLHGFPEYWAGWLRVFEQFADDYRVVALDQRGFNFSSKPLGIDNYNVKYMVADLLALVDHLSPQRPVILCGHDWGASVAYAFAMRHAGRVEKLVIANGVHPMCFQRALFAAGNQTKASQYMNWLRAEDSTRALSADNYKKMLSFMEGFSPAPWLNDERREGYIAAWSQPGAVDAMLNWYRASPMIIPAIDAPARQMVFDDDQLNKYAITMPHLLLWGMKDQALLTESRQGLEQFCPDLKIIEVADADHWIVHSHPTLVAREIQKFIGN